jgi:hypothetical protein
MRSGNDTAVRARVARGLTAVPAITLAALAVGCGSTTAGTATAARPTASLPLGTAVSATGATWTVLPMGVPRGHNLFWQLFVLPAGGRQWKLATPPDVDTNGAFAVSVTGAQSLAAGVRPSQLLRFSPVSSTANGGRTWLAGPPDPGLAEVPDALAAAPQGGQLLALDRTGRVEQGRTGWTTLTSLRRLAATSAARSCAPAALTAVAFSPSGPPVVAARCARPGSAGIFAEQGGQWSAAGPTLPGALSGQRIEVLRLVRTGSRLTALLQSGSGPAARRLVAWQAADGRWTVSAPLPGSGAVLSSSFGASGAIVVELTGRRAEFLAGPGAAWQALPRLPQGHAVTLALPASGGVDALAADGSVLTAWRLHASGSALGAGQWAMTQTIKVPIQYGSSS